MRIPEAVLYSGEHIFLVREFCKSEDCGLAELSRAIIVNENSKDFFVLFIIFSFFSEGVTVFISL